MIAGVATNFDGAIVVNPSTSLPGGVRIDCGVTWVAFTLEETEALVVALQAHLARTKPNSGYSVEWTGYNPGRDDAAEAFSGHNDESA